MKQYSVYTKLDGHIGKFSDGKTEIDDTKVSSTTTYSSKKIETRLSGLSFSVTENGILRVSY